MAAMSIWLWTQRLDLFEGWADLTSALGTLFNLPISLVMSENGPLLATVHAGGDIPSLQYSAVAIVAISVAAIVGSYLIPVSKVPARYFLRTVGAVLLLPLLGYGLLGGELKMGLDAHLASVFKTGYWFMVLMPLFFGITGFVLPGNLVYKTLVTLAALFYFYCLVPVVGLFHYQMILSFGYLITPFLSVFFGVLLFSLEMVAFYGVLASQP
jgi:hypothetical protein